MNIWKPAMSKPIVKFPKTVQQSIPIKKVYGNGIFEHNDELSICCSFTDINYQSTSSKHKAEVLLSFEELLKGIDVDDSVSAKIVLSNKKLPKQLVANKISISEKKDGYDSYREEINNMNMAKEIQGSNCIQREKFITISLKRKSYEESVPWFNRVEAMLTQNFREMQSFCKRMSSQDRLYFFHNFFRSSDEKQFNLSFDLMQKKCEDVKDYIAPDGMEFHSTYFRIEEKYGRALVLREFSSHIRDTLITDIIDLPQEMLLAIDIIPKSKEASLKVIERKRLELESEISNATKKATQGGNWNAVIPPHLNQKRNSFQEIYECLVEQDQRIMLSQIIVVHFADSIEQLNIDTDRIKAVSSSKNCQFGILRYQQEEGLNTVLPYGLRFVDCLRTLSSENVACLMPFNAKEISDKNGICYATNAISKNLIILDRKHLKNPNAMFLGIPGSGKSMFAKIEMANVFLSTDDDMLILDPEREYAPLVKLFDGEIVQLSAGSNHHINAMDISKDYRGEDDPIAIKSEFIISLCEMAVGTLNAKEKSIIDKVSRKILNKAYSFLKNEVATLKTLSSVLYEMKDPDAAHIADCLDLYVNGSLNIFAHKTNVDINNRLVCFDIKDMGTQLKGLAMLIVLDTIFSRVAYNRQRGKNTWVWVDEIWVLFKYGFAAEYLESFWRRMRKYGGIMTGITQNTTDLLNSIHANNILSDSEMIAMFNQATSDKNLLVPLFGISESEERFITNTSNGMGLLSISGNLIPFDAEFNCNTSLYRAMTTKIEEIREYEYQK